MRSLKRRTHLVIDQASNIYLIDRDNLSLIFKWSGILSLLINPLPTCYKRNFFPYFKQAGLLCSIWSLVKHYLERSAQCPFKFGI